MLRFNIEGFLSFKNHVKIEVYYLMSLANNQIFISVICEIILTASKKDTLEWKEITFQLQLAVI